ncbi:TonB-dependent receptor [Flavicella sediminum]|uniref:TonB-dependent receptor n=1 Tax=Flavicella sediminum TaxID=2585141 RepID=UPI0011215EC2|nr:TonB-dependent receptor [Flavicella sediminum]
MKKRLFFFFVSSILSLNAQITFSGNISSAGNKLPYATVLVKNNQTGTTTDSNGQYSIETKNTNEITLVASYAGYLSKSKTFYLSDSQKEIHYDFELTEHSKLLDIVTVTGTRTDKRQTKSPVIVNVINSVKLNDVQACNLSEGLKFQTGLRVETDCQTCNYTQLRMNGLGGGYSQILINGRPIFSPLTGLYGLEQIPTNMIDRIEVVRGGGSALYGSSAVGGTVNVITQIPKKNDYSVGYTYLNTDGADDHIYTANATFVNDLVDKGISFFFNKRDRDLYDANDDHFSELPQLNNLSFGTSLFFLPTENQKIEINLSKIHEFRYGGDMLEKTPHLSQQSEERTHNVYVGNIDYQINFNEDKSSFITYLASQYTDRDHYTGIFPDEPNAIAAHEANPPYGTSKTTTFQAGIQLNHKLEHFLNGTNVLTIGSEFVQDDVVDDIEAYQYKIDQLTKNTGVFAQSDWEISEKTNLVTGVRFDHHKLVDLANNKNLLNTVFSPRISFLYTPIPRTQLRATWGKGFRAPQAFDTDLHIAFAGGGISRVTLSDNLKRETSNSFSTSLNFDKPTEHYIYGFTLESFYTHLQDAFYLHPLGEDGHGELFEKRNGDGATVKGITLEARFNWDQILQFEGGYTFQSSLFTTAVDNFGNLPAKRKFLRTPNNYGYATLTIRPNKKFKTAINLVQTGKMDILHLIPNPENTNETIGTYVQSSAFTELGFKSSYLFKITQQNKLEIFGGVKNLFDAYQSDFDSGKNRDSNYIYGPSNPRTLFIGLKFGSNLGS